MDSNDLAKDISKFKLTGPLVEPINWAMRGRPDGTPGQDKDPNGGNLEYSEVGDFENSSGRNNYNDGEFENEWPEGLDVEVKNNEPCPPKKLIINWSIILKLIQQGPAFFYKFLRVSEKSRHPFFIVDFL
jgi:hypothetical protein